MAISQGSKPNNLVQTIERTSLILDALGENPHGISVRDLSSRVRLPKGTTHRLLSSLTYFGYVRQDLEDKKLPFSASSWWSLATFFSVNSIFEKRQKFF